MQDFSKKRKTQKYLNSLLKKLKGAKVKSVFSVIESDWDTYHGYRECGVDGDVFIRFENDMCMVISYFFVDELKISFRELTDEEKRLFDDVEVKDFFNDSQDNETTKLEYADIRSVSLKPLTGEYTKRFKNDNVEYVKAKRDTFNEITFEMSNGKSFTIGADDTAAGDEGATYVWSKDAEWREDDVCSV